MIFVTVGSQLPFDRLIKAIDEWAGVNKDKIIFAQIGVSVYEPKNIAFCQTMTPEEYSKYFDRADFIVAHAGMGTIISALEHEKNLLLMPRLACKGEHRNDHQLATARRFLHFSNISVADNEVELLEKLGSFVNKHIEPEKIKPTEVSANLIASIKNFVNDK